ncbi:auxin response factor 19-like [Dorcoceras hygrometricum]|uniref:Auxin response factor 19-like n=1 Tax=Dorcoceras hygrometricum TaxID=472368 RepID=A0A2Z7CW70_9LAMI|nr:auxin response factor 19-like [Dorcoceras hygrometricum]
MAAVGAWCRAAPCVMCAHECRTAGATPTGQRAQGHVRQARIPCHTLHACWAHGGAARCVRRLARRRGDSVATTDGEDQPAETAEERQWFDLPYEDIMAQLDAERPVVTASDIDEEMEQVDVFTEISVRDQQVQTFVEDPADEEMSCDGEQAVDERIDADEAMSLEDIILSIPIDVPLPSTGVEITKITMGKEIKIPGVDERTWHLASLPRIKVDDKGKEPLKQKDSIKGRPHLEHYSLICADIDLIVKLRAQVIDEVDQFFNSFRLKKLATINIEDMTMKDEQVLYWGEAESTLVALQRKGYILLKYRKILVRKFLESWKQNFVPGDGSSATDLKVIAMLSDLHLFVLEELKEQAIAHGLTWTKTCCSKIFEGHTRDRGAVIARNNTSIPSKCWIQTMIRVDGVWAVEPCADHWVKIPRPVMLNEVPRQCSYVDTLPTVSKFFKIMTKRWADVCLEVVEFCVSGKLLPVGSINLCRSLPVAQPVFSVAPHQLTVLALRISQFCTVFLDYSLFSSLPTADIRSFVGSIASERTVLRNVQIIQASGSIAPHVQLLDEHPLSASTSEDSAMNFDEIDTAATSTSLPAASIPKITEALAQLRASIEQISERDDGAKHKDTLLLHLHDFERKFTAHFDAQDRVLGALRKDSNDQRILMSLDLKSSHKQLSTQISTNALDVVDVRRVVREHHQELNAKITSLDEQVAATRNDLLEFSAQAQQTLNIITAQLSELVAYINHGGNDKKGEVSSSRPPPDDQNRGSGNTGGGGDTDRSIVERLLTVDRQRERSRGHSSGSYKRRRY